MQAAEAARIGKKFLVLKNQLPSLFWFESVS
jgi:hypothetical protein